MKYPKDLYPVQSRPHAIWNNVAGIWHNKLASTVDTTWMAECRAFSQKTHSKVDSHNHQPCGLVIIFGNEAGFLVEVLQRCGQPPNLHLLPTSQRFA